LRGLKRNALLLVAAAAVAALVPGNLGLLKDGVTPLLSAAEAEIDPSPYRSAAVAIRRGDFDAASRSIADLRTANPERDDEARVILGLYAAKSGRYEVAEHALAEPGGLLDDYRLLNLAESQAESGKTEASLETFSKLIEGDAPSPIQAHALLRAVEISQTTHPLDALRFVQISRTLDIDTDAQEELEQTAWKLAGDLGLETVQREVGRELLARFPLVASEVSAIELFRSEDGLDWSTILLTDQLFDRADNLLQAKLYDGALQALDEISVAQRNVRWSLLKARALTSQKLGDAALAVLQSARPTDATEVAEVAFRRAEAALEVGTARRGKSLDSDTRLAMKSAARGYLWDTVRAAGDEKLTVRALRKLHEELIEDELFDEAVGILQRLRTIDPRDNTGVEHLWECGWQEYSNRNHSGAIGYWSQLRELYPDHNRSRSALYWSARAHEQLGGKQRAQELYRAVVSSPTTDFYSRYALRRLPKGTGAVAQSTTAAPDQHWPEDAALRRAETLYELGLDDLSLLEMESVAEISDPRALNGLRATVFAAQGRRRDSIRAVWRAFPTLGKTAQDGVPERAKRLYYPLAFEEIIRTHADRAELPVDLVFAMIRQESAFDAGAHSWAGARGLMQVMPATGKELAQRLGVPYSKEKLKEPGTSVLLGTSYFQQVLKMFDGNVELALAGYNGGPYRIKRLWREAPPGTEIDTFVEGLGIQETKTYVKRILLFSDSYERLYFQGG